MRIPYGSYKPDLPPLSMLDGDLLVAKNVVPRGVGYGPFNAFASGSYGSLTARARGGIAVISRLGTPHTFAGDVSKLYQLSSFTGSGTPGTMTDVSEASGYSLTGSSRWEFVYFSNTVYAVCPDQEIQYFDLQSSTTFDEIAGAGFKKTIPRGRHVGIIGAHMVIGDTYHGDDGGRVSDQIWWPAINNPRSWPTPGTDAATSAQSGKQKLEGEGGFVQAVASGAEVGAIFQEHRIWRMQYVGGDAQFQLDAVETRRGLMIPGLAVPYGREVLFYAEDGWYVFDYTQSIPVGEDVINRTFATDLDTAYLDRVSWANIPETPITVILYPGSGNSSGTPNKILFWNWVTRQFSTAEPGSLELITHVIPPVASLDADPQTEDIDVVDPTLSLDDRASVFGARTLAAYNTSNTLGVFTGAALEGVIEMGDLELGGEGRRSLVNGVRPHVKGIKATTQIAPLDFANDAVTYGPVSAQARDGECKHRVDARYHRIRTTLPAGFTDAIGVDVDARPTGRV